MQRSVEFFDKYLKGVIASEGPKDDLKTGEQVAVFGQENSDDSVTAQNIQLNPTAKRMFNQHPEGQ